MANERYITAVLPEHSRSALDRLLEAEEKEAEKYTITTTKELLAIKRAAYDQIQAEFGVNEMAGMKRKINDPINIQNKRFAMDGFDGSNRQAEDSNLAEVDENIFFTVNYDKYNMIFRNETIVDYATERVNRTAGQVIKAFFEYGKDEMKNVKEDDTPSATPMHIANLLSPELLTQGDIILQQDPLNKNKPPSTQDAVRGYITLLKMDQAGFIKNKDERGANQFTVNLAKLRESMKRKLLESLLRERLGVATCRIARILIEKGKLDESQVQKLAMLPPKDTREKLAQLNLHGFVEIQEVPKSADRAPGRSFHLWYVPLEKCYEELLVDIYRVIGNLQQRKKEELALRERLLEKLNRQDVKENMDLLSDGDKANMENMEKVLQRLETSKNRLDAMVMILRDF
ncbi:RNA polymerase III subunit RPC82-domain-containing protein [Halteromyces radiatus]|uniref:RNA polymerase III subunit RPC82-domain-containing protein n=1 Tax=Halteromyces radiatus TaxID=101107 RepID=UPI00221F542E|nr:RNA polymerase III subunit RPC82-domain-containing protein [Halteromyces radiatus]KAI8081289.1 RNA polymerase III subunit RPC82-domain-containing protein [Halteromyces radiatus]